MRQRAGLVMGFDWNTDWWSLWSAGAWDTAGKLKNVRQTSVCRGFRQWANGGNQRQTEVCRTFPAPFRPAPEFASDWSLLRTQPHLHQTWTEDMD